MSAFSSSSGIVARSGRGSTGRLSSSWSVSIEAAAAAKGQVELESSGRCGGFRLHDLLDESAVLLLQGAGVLLRAALRVQVDERLVRVREDLRPASLVEDLDPVHQLELAVLEALGEDAHHEPLQRPGAVQLAVDERRCGQVCDELG